MAGGGTAAATTVAFSTTPGTPVIPSRAEGRLSVFSGVPIPTGSGGYSDNLYYMPFNGNHISLFKEGRWQDFVFSQIQISKAGLNPLEIHDVYAYGLGNDVILELGLAWDEWYDRDVDPITYLDGIAVRASDPTRRLIGTIMTTPEAQFVDSSSARFTSNLYNTVSLPMGTCDGYVNVDAETVVPFTPPDNTWTFFMPTFNIGNYVDWILCEPRNVSLRVVFCLKNIDADSVGCAVAIGVGPEHGTQTPSDIIVGIRRDGAPTEWQGCVPYDSMRPLGSCQGYQTFFASGKTHSMGVLASDAFHGGTKATPATYIEGWINN